MLNDESQDSSKNNAKRLKIFEQNKNSKRNLYCLSVCQIFQEILEFSSPMNQRIAKQSNKLIDQTSKVELKKQTAQSKIPFYMDIQFGYINCDVHRSEPISLIRVRNVDKGRIFCCLYCQNDIRQFQGDDYLPLKLLLDDQEKGLIKKWPPVNDTSIIENLICEAKNLEPSSKILDDISKFFDDFRNQLNSKLGDIQKTLITEVQKDLPYDNEEVIKRYEEISKIVYLKNMVRNGQNESIQNLEQSCQPFLSEMEAIRDSSDEQLQELLTEIICKKNLISFTQPRQNIEQIFSILSSMNFFNAQQDEELKSKSSKLDRIMELIQNKSNFCSDSFLIQVKDKLNMLTDFSHIEFDRMYSNNKTNPIRFSEISDGQFEMIQRQVDHWIKINQKDVNYIKEIENDSVVKQMQQLIRSEVNSIDKDFQKLFMEFLKDQYPSFNLIKSESIFNDNGRFNTLHSQTYQDINQLVQVLSSRQELLQNQQSFQQSQTFQFINNLSEVNRFLFDQNEIEQILRQFPVFELTKQKYQDILGDFQLRLTNYNDGNQRIKINQIEQNQQIVCIDQQKYKGKSYDLDANCVSDIILDKDAKYLFRIKVSFPSEKVVYPTIGLMSKRKSDEEEGYQSKLFSTFESKGNQLLFCEDNSNAGDNSNQGEQRKLLSEENIVEMRVCLKNKQLEVLDYPNYNFKLSLQEDQKDKFDLINDLVLYLRLENETYSYTLLEAYKVE